MMYVLLKIKKITLESKKREKRIVETGITKIHIDQENKIGENKKSETETKVFNQLRPFIRDCELKRNPRTSPTESHGRKVGTENCTPG